MGKMIWNLIGAILIIATMCAFVYCFAEQTACSGIILLAIAVVDMGYAEKRPTWIEV